MMWPAFVANIGGDIVFGGSSAAADFGGSTKASGSNHIGICVASTPTGSSYRHTPMPRTPKLQVDDFSGAFFYDFGRPPAGVGSMISLPSASAIDEHVALSAPRVVEDLQISILALVASLFSPEAQANTPQNKYIDSTSTMYNPSQQKAALCPVKKTTNRVSHYPRSCMPLGRLDSDVQYGNHCTCYPFIYFILNVLT
jgi:hypothetical protein